MSVNEKIEKFLNEFDETMEKAFAKLSGIDCEQFPEKVVQKIKEFVNEMKEKERICILEVAEKAFRKYKIELVDLGKVIQVLAEFNEIELISIRKMICPSKKVIETFGHEDELIYEQGMAIINSLSKLDKDEIREVVEKSMIQPKISKEKIKKSLTDFSDKLKNSDLAKKFREFKGKINDGFDEILEDVVKKRAKNKEKQS